MGLQSELRDYAWGLLDKTDLEKNLILRTELVAAALHDSEEVVIVISVNIGDGAVWHNSLELYKVLCSSVLLQGIRYDRAGSHHKRIHTAYLGTKVLLQLSTLRCQRRLALLVRDEYQ